MTLAFWAVATAVTAAIVFSDEVDGFKEAGVRLYFDASALFFAGTALLFARLWSAAVWTEAGGGTQTRAVAVAELVLLPFLFLKLASAVALLELGVEVEPDLFSDVSTLLVVVLLLITLLVADGATGHSGAVASFWAMLHSVLFSVAAFFVCSHPVDGDKTEAIRFEDLDLYLLFVAGVELLWAWMCLVDARRREAAAPANPVV